MLAFITVTLLLSTVIPCIIDNIIDFDDMQLPWMNLAVNLICSVVYYFVKFSANRYVYNKTSQCLETLMFPGTLLISLGISLLWKYVIKERISKRLIFKFFHKNRQLKRTWKNIQYTFSNHQNNILLKDGKDKKVLSYAVCGVGSQTFMNLVISGKANLYGAQYGYLEEKVCIPESMQDCHCDDLFKNAQFMVGICQTKHSGLIFYPESQKEMRRVYCAMCQKTAQDQKLAKLKHDMDSLQAIQNEQNQKNQQIQADISENQKRMAVFLEEFQEENASGSLHIDDPESETEDLFPLDADALKPKLKL